MKNIKYYILLYLMAGLVFLPSCNDDFLQQDPIQELAEGSFLKNEGDLPYYLNQLYNRYISGHQSGWAYDRIAPFYDIQGSPIIYNDLFSDNMVKSGGASSRLNESFRVPSSGTNEGWKWENLRLVNYFLRNYRQAEESVNDPSELDKWAAEAYFFKAYDYYQKVLIFGDVPWYTQDLNIDSEELYAPRTKREEVMDSVLWCINFAVEHIQDNSANPIGRINRDMANFLKARICLFEGTFRKYHTELGLQNTADKYLEECVKASEALVETGRYQLYNTGTDPYWKLFTFKEDPATDGHKEAILARIYDGQKQGHATQRYYEQNNGGASGRYSKGATRSLVDEYLCEDGRPIYTGGTEGNYAINSLFRGYDGLWTELENRDPRLRQTIARPGEYVTISTPGSGVMDRSKYGIVYPAIAYNYTTAPGTTVTGYWFIKHWMCDKEDFDATTNGRQTAIVFRYGEALLMLAEAKAELGTITNNDLDNTINVLRKRAGFDFTKYPNSRLTKENVPADPRLDKIYAEKLDYPVSPLLREIRRERRVEMVMEGLRYEDMMRWKAGKLFTTPLRGMKFTAEKQKLYDGSNATPPAPVNANSITAKKAVIGTEVWIDSEGFLIAYPRDARVIDGVLPWSDKRYYWPIPFDQLTLNKNLTQTPGWEDIQR
ncbi:MAG: RagB/SusD family nutrient uptake outer membrane protein [Dysgonamonadaceae bacterium]|nr:RagB/SusD family nutrient uptake outer membrane protein [Dysgonamonadaceae bacterium]